MTEVYYNPLVTENEVLFQQIENKLNEFVYYHMAKQTW